MDFLSASGLRADLAFCPALSRPEICLPGPSGGAGGGERSTKQLPHAWQVTMQTVARSCWAEPRGNANTFGSQTDLCSNPHYSNLDKSSELFKVSVFIFVKWVQHLSPQPGGKEAGGSL